MIDEQPLNIANIYKTQLLLHLTHFLYIYLAVFALYMPYILYSYHSGCDADLNLHIIFVHTVLVHSSYLFL